MFPNLIGVIKIFHNIHDLASICPRGFASKVCILGSKALELLQKLFIFFAPSNHLFINYIAREELKDLVQCMGARLGRSPKVKPQKQIDKESIGNSLRNEAEATFGTSKRVYRADNIRAKLPGTAECWTGMCYYVKNLTKILRGLCRVLTEKLPFGRILGIIGLAIGVLPGKYCCHAVQRQEC